MVDRTLHAQTISKSVENALFLIVFFGHSDSSLANTWHHLDSLARLDSLAKLV